MNAIFETLKTPDYTAIKTKQNAAWSAGNYAKVGITLQIVGEELAETMNMAPDTTIVDVAAGNGNATLAFARRFCDVTSTDYVSALLDNSSERAGVEGLDVRYQVADAENLPFDDGKFEGVVSTFGVMFTPNQKQAASELVRVCRSGGKIGMANWTPASFIGQLFKTLGKHITPPAGVKSPGLWGDEEWIGDTFSKEATSISLILKNFNFRYRSPEHFVDYFRTFYGPMQKAFLSLDESGQKELDRDLHDLIARVNTETDGSVRLPSEYAEVVITKK